MSEVVDAYNRILRVKTSELEKLEKKQKKNDSTKEENEIISKFYFERMINMEKTPEEVLANMFYDLWLDRTKRKIILHNYYYAKSYYTVLKKEIEETLCTEKMENLAEKQEVLKEIEKELGVDHGDESTIITIERINKCHDYLKKNHKRIHDKVFKMRDQSKKKNEEETEEESKVKYSINLLNKIYKNFYGYVLKVTEVDPHTKSSLGYRFNATESFKYEYIWKKEDLPKYLFIEPDMMAYTGEKVVEDKKANESKDGEVEEIIKQIKDLPKYLFIEPDMMACIGEKVVEDKKENESKDGEVKEIIKQIKVKNDALFENKK